MAKLEGDRTLDQAILFGLLTPPGSVVVVTGPGFLLRSLLVDLRLLQAFPMQQSAFQSFLVSPR